MAPSASLPPQPTAARPSGSGNGRLCLAPLRRQQLCQRPCRGFVWRFAWVAWAASASPGCARGRCSLPACSPVAAVAAGAQTLSQLLAKPRSSPVCASWPARRLAALKRTRCNGGFFAKDQTRSARIKSASPVPVRVCSRRDQVVFAIDAGAPGRVRARRRRVASADF